MTYFKSIYWFECLLWSLFLLLGLYGISNESDYNITFSGLCLIGAIGLRATRAPHEVADEK